MRFFPFRFTLIKSLPIYWQYAMNIKNYCNLESNLTGSTVGLPTERSRSYLKKGEPELQKQVLDSSNFKEF